MKHKLYKELNKEEKALRVVSIPEELAEKLSKDKNHPFTYVLKTTDDSKKVIKLNDEEFELKKVIDSYNEIEGIKALNKNTGEEKVLKAISELEEGVKESFISGLTE